jgi:hypothetical protein
MAKVNFKLIVNQHPKRAKHNRPNQQNGIIGDFKLVVKHKSGNTKLQHFIFLSLMAMWVNLNLIEMWFS